jgi:hypothetical protein
MDCWGSRQVQTSVFPAPVRAYALSVVNELAANGFREAHMHAVADLRIPLPGLPNATTRQKHKTGRCAEKLLGNANLALGSFITLAILYGLTMSLLLCSAVMVATFPAGPGFTRTSTRFMMPSPTGRSC